MSEQTLKFGENVVNKKDFHSSKQAITSNSVDSSKILVSDKFKLSDNSCRFFIGYSVGGVIRPLCIILPQMSGYIKYLAMVAKICYLKLKRKVFI